MRYRTLGSTGLRISAVAIGCGNVGGLFTGPASDQQTEAVKCTAEFGINWFDTAPQYGQGNSERNLGRALREVGPKEAFVSTKVRLVFEDLRDTPGAILRSLEASLERLGMDRVALVQLHNPVTDARGTRRDAIGLFEDLLARHGVLEGLDRLRGERLCQAVGLTGLGDTAALKMAVRSGGFQTIQVYYNLLNPSAGLEHVPQPYPAQDYEHLLQDVADMHMGALAIRVLAAGALGDPMRPGQPGAALSPGSALADDQRRAAALVPLTKRYEIPLPQAAVRFALGDPRVSTALVGASDLGQIEEAVEAEVTGALPGEFLDEWRRLLETDFGLLPPE